MKSPKVLVGVVTYEGKDYIFDRFYKNIKSLDYDNYDLLFVDNSRTKHYYSKLLRRGCNVIHVNRGANARIAQERSLNKIREYVLNNDYDYFLCVESDLLPPRDIIHRLIKHDKPVVGCMYTIGFPNSAVQPVRPCLFHAYKKEDGTGATRNLERQEGFSYFGNGLQPIHGCGLGTTLIRRDIIEKFPFKHWLGTPIKNSDVLFFMDLHNAGIQAYVDTDLIIPHYNVDWGLVKDA